MSGAVTIDDVDARFFEAEAATSRTKSSVKAAKKNATVFAVFTIARDLWSIDRKLKELVELCNNTDLTNVPGATCQHFEKRLTSLIGSLQQCLALCNGRGLNNRTLTAGALRSIEHRTEDLKDMWVTLSSSTDAELDEALKLARCEESSEWESVWQ